MKTNFTAVLSVVTTLFLAHPRSGSCAEPIVECVQKELAKNGFNTGRSLRDYERELPTKLMESLTALKAGETWIDMGCGHGKALRDFAHATPLGQLPRLIGVRYSEPERPPGQPRVTEGLPIQILEGSLLEDIPLQRMGGPASVAVITDDFGPAAYTHDLAKVIRIYGQLLKTGGQAFIADDRRVRLEVKIASSSAPPNVLNYMPITYFIHNYCRGLRATYSNGATRVVRTSDPLFVPDMALVSYEEGAPPSRQFRMDLPPGSPAPARFESDPTPPSWLNF